MTTEEMKKELEEKISRIAVLQERSRMMDEMIKADLPLGVWPAVKNIINPELNSTNLNS